MNNPTIQDLYNGTKVIKVQFIGKSHPYHVYLSKDEFNGKTMDYENKPDCRICSWADNVWFRTPKGVDYSKYKSIGTLKQAITLSAKSRGLHIESFTIQDPKK